MQMSRQSKGFRIFKEGPWFLNLTLFGFESVLCLVPKKPNILNRAKNQKKQKKKTPRSMCK
ncbi:hypothetical protein Hanom_Chr04g00312891 [Helianthus anomalus]